MTNLCPFPMYEVHISASDEGHTVDLEDAFATLPEALVSASGWAGVLDCSDYEVVRVTVTDLGVASWWSSGATNRARTFVRSVDFQASGKKVLKPLDKTYRPRYYNCCTAPKEHDRKEPIMARNYVQKRFTDTIVHGFTIRDGQPVQADYKIDRKVGLKSAQTLVRKTDPSFAAVSVEEVSTLYTMTFDKFKELATPVADPDPDGVDPNPEY